MNDIVTRRLDELTRQYTAFTTFEEFCQRGMLSKYSPTLSRRNNAEVTELADAFDAWQRRWQSPIRAWRGL